jgi:voltage-gated potassium channel
MPEGSDMKLAGWRRKLHEIIYEADTPEGKLFDVLLLVAIALSVIVVMLDSVADYRNQYGEFFLVAEVFFTALFTIEYILRIISVGKPFRYIFSFFGIIDLLAIIPGYFLFLNLPFHQLVAIRILRLLRIFRIFKLSKYTWASKVLMLSIRQNRGKIIVFLLTVFSIVTIMGSIMFVVEGKESGFDSIPKGIYWAIITLTTVGYGDIVPQTNLGKFIASFVMILGYSIIAVPTGLVSVGIANASKKEVSGQACPQCSKEGHEVDAIHCKFCGAILNPVRE